MKAYEYLVKIKGDADKKLQMIADAAGVADDNMDGFREEVDRASGSSFSLGGALKSIAPLLIGIFSFAQLSAFNSELVSTRAEFEKYEAVLTNTFQSAEMGKASMQFISDFASTTPFQVDKLTDSFVKLANRGFIPTKAEMTSMGDLAASQGKSFEQYTEALLDAQTGEFERLKEFGIKASKAGDQVTFMFKGQQSTVQATESAIKDYLISIGQMDGVSGSMEAISNTLGGMISNLMDKSTQLRNKWGGDLSDLYKYVIKHLGGAIDWLMNNVNLSGFASRVIGFFDAIKPAFGSLWASLKILGSAIYEVLKPFVSLFGGLSKGTSVGEKFAGVIGMIATGATILAQGIETLSPLLKLWVGLKLALALQTGILTAAQWALNIAMTANPIGLVIAGIVALVGVVTYAWQKVEWFRGGILGAWEAIKDLASMVGTYLVSRFKELLKTVVGVGETLWYVMTGQFKKALDSGKDALKNYVGVDSKKQLYQDAKGLGESFSKGYEDGVGQVAEINKRTFKDGGRELGGRPNGSAYEDMLDLFNTDNPRGGDGTNQDGDVSKGLSSITSGGSKQTNITINIGKLNEQINIATTNLQQGAKDVEKVMAEMLLRVTNSANQTQS